MARKIQRLGIPTLLVSGSDDMIAPREQVERLAGVLQCEARFVDGVGHMVVVEKPHEWRKHVIPFLNSE